MEFSNSPLPHPATWLADELMRLEHNLDGEKGKHCCATWTAKNPTPTYCTVPASSSCLAWGQKATVRDYSTVDDKMCEGKGRCWPASESARWPQPNLPDLEKVGGKMWQFRTGPTRGVFRRACRRNSLRFSPPEETPQFPVCQAFGTPHCDGRTAPSSCSLWTSQCCAKVDGWSDGKGWNMWK